MEPTTLTYQPETLLVIIIVMLLVGIVIGACVAVAVYKELVAPPEDLVKEELATMRSAQRLAAAATRTRQAMRRETRSQERDAYQGSGLDDDFDSWEDSCAR